MTCEHRHEITEVPDQVGRELSMTRVVQCQDCQRYGLAHARYVAASATDASVQLRDFVRWRDPEWAPSPGPHR